MKYRALTLTVDAISFADLVAYGIEHGASCINGMPWSFSYNGYYVTHENDTTYIITRIQDGTMPPQDAVILTEKHVLVMERNGHMFPCTQELFDLYYVPVPTVSDADARIAAARTSTAENLIVQLPASDPARNRWLMLHGTGPEAQRIRKENERCTTSGAPLPRELT